MFRLNISNRTYKAMVQLEMQSYLVEAYITKSGWQPGKNKRSYVTVVLNEHLPKEVKTRIAKHLLSYYQTQGGLSCENIEEVKVRRNYYHESATFKAEKDAR